MRKQTEIMARAMKKALNNGWSFLPEDTRPYFAGFWTHRFAKAFWGEYLSCHLSFPQECKCRDLNGLDNVDHFRHNKQPVWWMALKQMVISDDPIEYLGRFIDGELNE